MLPAVVATELREGVRRFLRATFPMTNPGFRRMDGGTPLEDLLADPEALFKGPYLSLGLPFRAADPEARLPFEHVTLEFLPYRHQARAFERLAGTAPRSTLVATGTGSGKTESFLYPLLEDSAARPASGVKAIVIYPMNALAKDQATRIAREIYGRDPLRGRVSVGLFVGDRESASTTGMSADSVITDHDTLRKNPPDILLTNYKMLDFLLMRPQDQGMWRFNEPDTLRYLVVDELHTFDGAQGTDLACLIRRLRDRLSPDGKLACVGTSATIGGAEAAQTLRDYAEQVFATPFDDESVILEERLRPREYLEAEEQREQDEGVSSEGGVASGVRWPGAQDLGRMQARTYSSSAEYLRAQAEIWLGERLDLEATDPARLEEARVALGRRLVGHMAFEELLGLTEQGLISLPTVAADWVQRFRLDTPEQAMLMLDSLLALVSAARRRVGKRLAPLVEVRVQLWLRELRRMVASVSPEPALNFGDDTSTSQPGLSLPVAHCRECHATGWASVKRPDEGRLEDDLRSIYSAWFGNHQHVCLMFPLEGVPPREPTGFVGWVCGTEGQLRVGRSGDAGGDDPCESGEGVRVWHPDMTRERTHKEHKYRVSHHDCPFCGASEGLSLLGARAASLSSVLIGQLYHSLHNEHHKLIAFSDSVQDAAHRAGFFEARTYSTLVRRAIAQFMGDRGRGQDLAAIARDMPRHWRQALGDDAAFAGTFIAPNMVWLRDYEQLVATDALPSNSNLPDLIGQRLEWEVIQAFGLRARIGRTLERGRIAAVGVDIDGDLTRTARALTQRLSEEIGSLRDVPEPRVKWFLQGLLWRGRTRGAFYHPFLEPYIQARGKTYAPFSLNPFMPNYGGAARPPALWTLGHIHRSFDNLHGESGSWFKGWFERVLATDAQVLASPEFRQVMTLTVDRLKRDGWLEERPIGDQSVWGLDPQRWYGSTIVQSLSCTHCGHPLEVTDEEASHWVKVPCLRNSCEGHYEGLALQRRDELQDSRAAPKRLVTAEHTALLDGDSRAAIETSFKREDPYPWDVNLLSATPTLEMGIDIGDLSSVLLCSVPPSQSNYLQRIGRAGRRDGNSLAVTVANGGGHDNYFFEEPLKMLAGSIEPPGVFLNAAAVLERQLMAFCLDRWAASGVAVDAIPGRMQIVLDAVEKEDATRFPYTWLTFVAAHRRTIMDDFAALFPDLERGTQESLHRFLFGTPEDDQPGLDWRLTNRLKDTVNRRRGWTQRVDRLKREITNLESEPEDEAVRERLAGARAEREALMSLRRHLNNQHTLNFLTDEGLIPNYAFPEEGVTLQSIILRRTRGGDGENQGMERLNFQMQRSAEAALAELAPLNRFYAQGRAVEIDQVDLSSDQVREWRFCDNCQYVENLETSGDPHSVCPRCGSAQWADAEQRRSVLRMRQVFATAEDRESRIGDDADDRQPSFYTRQMLVDIEPNQGRKAWRLATEDLPFAFEYIPQVTLREINFGQLGAEEVEFKVAGDLSARPGFQICRHCGKVRRPRRPGSFPHAYDCKLARPGAQESEDDYHSSLYLFRELKSEAIRILLPLADFADSEVRLHSLIAALNLGLREYFRGSVDHLRVTDYTAPGEGSRRRYLLLYDSVPGGTGYLKQLLDQVGPLVEVLRRAYQVVHTCNCQEEEHRDGCYGCVLAWRDRYRMPQISRRAAEEMLGRMLEHIDTLEPIGGVEEVDLNHLVESELEQRFLEALLNADGVRASKQVVNGKAGYFLTLQGDDDAAPQAWKLELQKKLGAADGVRTMCQPDFVLWPVRAGEGQKPVAVFTDGFSVHYDKVADDTAKRQAILDSGRFYVWSLGWRDLPQSGKQTTQAAFEFLESLQRPEMVKSFNKLAGSQGGLGHAEYQSPLGRGPFQWLIRYLRDGQEGLDWLKQAAFSRALCALDKRTVDPAAEELRAAVSEELEPLVPRWRAEDVAGSPGGEVYAIGGALRALGRREGAIGLGAGVAVSTFGKDADALRNMLAVALFMDDLDAAADEGFEREWQAFWGASNLLQFQPRFSLSSALGVEGERYVRVVPTEQAASGGVESAEEAPPVGDPCWGEVLKYSLFGDEVQKLQQTGVPCPRSGHELQDDAGEIIAELELAWPDLRVGLLADPDAEIQATLDDLGWSVWVGLDQQTIQAVAGRLNKEP